MAIGNGIVKLILLFVVILFFSTIASHVSASPVQSKVSWYGSAICLGRASCRTASGKTFDWNANTAACWSEYPFGTKFLVSYQGRSVVVTCTDRGGFKKLGRFLDLSSGAFKQLAPLSRGVLNVDVEVIK